MIKKLKLAVFCLISLSLLSASVAAGSPPGPQSSSTGVEATISAPPPTQAATIAVPQTGQTFSQIPITVSGLCPSSTLVEIYKNNVFAGAVDCTNGSYSLQIDLFDGRNDLVARVYDALNQSGPDSATVTVTFSSPLPSNGPRISLTTQYAKRGAAPGSILSWPITLSGGTGPYAISVDWGDKTDPDLISQNQPGDLTLQHTYAQAGVYKVTVKASDSQGNAAFLQLVGIGNGKIQQSVGSAGSGILTNQKTKILWLPILLLAGLSLLAYWLGQKHQLEAIRRRLRRGEQPFK
ncbi:MAG TPA: PKD domain-containing protein [Candidatus Saccharimonadales bacterium]|nr:PKD domain-containing protein [Candidatus Saccharimonadales bacterium]